MQSLLTAVIVCACSMLALQAIWLLGKHAECSPARRLEGWLTLSLAMIGALGAFLVLQQKVVIADEFHLVLAEGHWHCGLRVLLVLICIAGSLLVQGARASREDKARNRWTVPVAFVLGVLVAWLQPQAVERDLPLQFRMYVLPLLFPPLVLFLVWCLLEWSLLVLGMQSAGTRLWLSFLALTAVATYGWSASEGFPLMAKCSWWWAASLYVCLGAAIWLLTMHALRPPTRGGDVSAQVVEDSAASSVDPSGARSFAWAYQAVKRAGPPFVALVAATLVVGLATGLIHVPHEHATWPPTVRHPVLLSTATTALVFVTIIAHLVQRGPREVWREHGAVLTAGTKIFGLLVCAAMILDLLWWQVFAQAGTIAIGLLTLLLMVEVTAGTPLKELLTRSIMVGGVGLVTPYLTALRVRFFEEIRKKDDTEGTPVGGVLRIRALRIGALCVAGYIAFCLVANAWSQRSALLVDDLDERSNAKSEPGLGRSIAVRVTHKVKYLSSLLRSDTMHRAVLGYRKSTHEDLSGGSDVVVDDSDPFPHGQVSTSVLKLGDWELPAAIVFDPVQRLLRWMLGTRLVSGNVLRSDEGYELLTTVDGWGTFRARGSSARHAADVLGTRLFIAQPQVQRLGVSDHHLAAAAFFEGLEAWRRYKRMAEIGAGEDARRAVIRSLTESIRIDPTAAASHYRLAVALWEDNQVVAAADEFRAAIQARPEFVAPHIGLAKLLLRLESADERYLTIASPAGASRAPGLGSERWHEAERVLLRALTLSSVTRTEEAAIRLLYCKLAAAQSESRSTTYYRAFYNCSRADALYSGITDDMRRVEQRALSAHLKARIIEAESIERVHSEAVRSKDASKEPVKFVTLPNGCSASGYAPSSRGMKWQYRVAPGNREARQWARLAVTLEPSNSEYSCHLASLELAAGNERPMLTLAHNPFVQHQLGNQLRRRAWMEREKRSLDATAGLFRSAAAAYARALRSSDSNPVILNDQAYNFRLWTFAEPRSAMHSARTALELTRGIRLAHKLSRQQPPSKQALMASTLGEILIAQGFFHSAAQILAAANEQVERDSVTPNELRWDLAQALICAAQEDGLSDLNKEGRCTRASATQVLSHIRHTEGLREYTPFSDPVLQDEEFIARGCPVVPGLPTRANVVRLEPNRWSDEQRVELDYALVVPASARGSIRGDFTIQVWSGTGQEADITLSADPGTCAVLRLPEVAASPSRHDPMLVRARWRSAANELVTSEPLSIYPCTPESCATRLMVKVEHQ